MLTKVQVYATQGVVTTMLELPLESDLISSNPLQIRNIEGLGPVKANILTTPYATYDGELFTNSSVGKRNIVMTIGLNPNWVDQSIESLRALLYDFLMPKMPVELNFFTTHMPTSSVSIDGYVESFETNIFSKDPEVQVSIVCPNADFLSNVVSLLSNQTVDADGASPAIIDYNGTVPTGFDVNIITSVARPSYTGSFVVWKTDAVQDALYFIGTVNATNTIHVSTRPGSKIVEQLTSGVSTNLLASVTDISTWPKLLPGSNSITVAATLAGQLWSISYRERFGGI